MKRLFAAIRTVPDKEFINNITALRQALRIHGIKWVEDENLHITVKFFGETAESLIPAISDVLTTVAASFQTFHYRYEGLGIFGSSYNPRIVWAGIHPYKELSGIIQLLKKELVSAGFPADRQNPVPHLTLGRINSIRDRNHFQASLDSFKNITSLPMMADNLILFESILSQSGPEYHVINSFPLKK